jgi:hypothetical protein
MNRHLAATLLAALVAVGSCSDATEPDLPLEPWPPSPGTDEIASLQLSSLDLLQVHEWRLLNVTAFDAGGRQVEMPWLPVFSSSDTMVATVSPEGVVRAVGVGSATIRAKLGDATAEAGVSGWARMRVETVPEFGWSTWSGPAPSAGLVHLAIGDTLQLAATFIDVDGVPLGPASPVEWISSQPDLVSVDATGRVATEAPGLATITASTAETEASMLVDVVDIVAGLPATVRLAHTAQGIPSVRFTLSEGDPVVLAFGESLERTVTSGIYIVTTSGLANTPGLFNTRFDYAAVIAPDDRLSLYAVGRPQQSFLTPVWAPTEPIPAGTGLVRLVQGWDEIGIFYMRPTGADVVGLPELCYFDPGDASDYFPRESGDFDVIVEQKFGNPGDYSNVEFARGGATAPDGGAVTYVVTGAAPGSIGLMAFTDR